MAGKNQNKKIFTPSTSPKKAERVTGEEELEEKAKKITPVLEKIRREEIEKATEEKAQLAHLPYINLFSFPVDPEALLEVKRKEAEESKVMPFFKSGRNLRLGVVNPDNPLTQKTLERLREEEGLIVEVYLISPTSLKEGLKHYEGIKVVEKAPIEEVRLAHEALSEFEKQIQNLEDLKKRIRELPTTEILNIIIAGAVKLEASDIHLEPQEGDKVKLRYRLDGVLQDVIYFDIQAHKKILNRVKIISGLKINVHDLPQDGSFLIVVGDNKIDVRTSILPGDLGENIVLRLLNRAAVALDIKDLGMRDRDFDIIKKALAKPNGMILTTGPTGSGKTTTLAACLTVLNKPEIKIITIEDPVEYRIKGIEQTEVNEEEGYTFARGLRSILRQDPDAILVGEIRDFDTAETAMHAALTGHIVLSTLHTNNASGTIPRLIDLGVRPFIIAPALSVVIAQRLVRRVCKKCREEYRPSPEQKEEIRKTLTGLPKEIFDSKILNDPKFKISRGKKCGYCNFTGYKGRIGIFEMFTITPEMEKMVLTSAPTSEIHATAVKNGMTTMAQDGVLKVVAGITTLEEVRRATEI